MKINYNSVNMDPINLCDKKNQINNLLQDIFTEYNRMNETKIQSKCENDLELRNMIDTIRDLEKSETNKMKQNELHEYEEMINSLQAKLEIADEEEQENNKFDMLRIQSKEITLKDREIDRLNRTIKNLKEKEIKSSDKIDSVIKQVTQKEESSISVLIEEKEKEEEEETPPKEDSPKEDSPKEDSPKEDSPTEIVEDKGERYTLTYRNKKYYIYENEKPQYVYEKLENGDVGEVLGERTINPKNGRYKTKLY